MPPSRSSRFHSCVWDSTQPPFLSRFLFSSESFGEALHASPWCFPAGADVGLTSASRGRSLIKPLVWSWWDARGCKCPGNSGVLSPGSAYMTKSPAPWHGCTSAGLQADLHWVAPGMLPPSQIAQCSVWGSFPPLPTANGPRGAHKGLYTAVVNSTVPGKCCQGRVGCFAPSTRCYGSPAGGGTGVQVSRDLCSVQEG